MPLRGRGVDEKTGAGAPARQRAHVDLGIQRLQQSGDPDRLAGIARRRRHDDFVMRQKSIGIFRDFRQQAVVVTRRNVAGKNQRADRTRVPAGEGIMIHIEEFGAPRRTAA